jgi:hypothetical protein
MNGRFSVFKRALTIYSVASVILAQQTTKSKTPAQEAKSGYTIMPVLIKDEGCARDYVKAQALGGLEGRKMLVDLIEYGCIKKL